MAQVITFGTHDMARAFDRWVDAFREVQLDNENCLRLDWKPGKASAETRAALQSMTCYDAIFPSADDWPRPGTANP